MRKKRIINKFFSLVAIIGITFLFLVNSITTVFAASISGTLSYRNSLISYGDVQLSGKFSDNNGYAYTRRFTVTGSNIHNSLGSNNAFCLDPRRKPVGNGASLSLEDITDVSKYYYSKIMVYFLYGGPGYYDNKAIIDELLAGFKPNQTLTEDQKYAYSHAILAYKYWGYGSREGLSTRFINQIEHVYSTITSNYRNYVMPSSKWNAFKLYLYHNDKYQDLFVWSFQEPKAYIELSKKFEPTSEARTTKLHVYTCGDSNCTTTGERLGSVDLNSENNYKATFGWNSSSNVGTLEPNTTYLIWEQGEKGGATADKAGTTNDGFTIVFDNPVVIKDSESNKYYTYGKVTTSDYSSSKKAYYGSEKVTNTKDEEKGYIELQKNYDGIEDDGESRVFALYNSHNGECQNITNNDLITYTSYKDGSGKYYLGWSSSKKAATLSLGKTYCIWEAADTKLKKAPDNYTASYSGGATTQIDDGWIYGKITLTGNNTYTDSDSGESYKYDVVNVTNTGDGTKIRVKKQVAGQANDSSNQFYNDYHFKFNIYEDCDTGEVAYLKTGQEFNSIVKSAKNAKNAEPVAYNTSDSTITSFERVSSLPSDLQSEIDNQSFNRLRKVSSDDSRQSVYVYYDNNKIYMYSEAKTIFLNEDSSYMFAYFDAITNIDLSGFDTYHATNMEGMFFECSSLTQLDVSNFNTSNVTNMSKMFYKCQLLTSLDVSSFNTSNVTDMSRMFEQCLYLNSLNLSSFDTSNVTNMYSMFSTNSGLTSLDVSSFNTTKVKDMSYMFNSMSKLTTIYASEYFVTTNVNTDAAMFFFSKKLVGENGTTYDSSHITSSYARIDAPSNQGYFTTKAYAPTTPNSNYSSEDTAYKECELLTTLLTNNDGITDYWKVEEETPSAQRAKFIKGSSFNDILTGMQEEGVTDKFLRASSAPASGVTTTNIAASDSDLPIVIWKDGDKIYWWSEDLTPYLNPNSYAMFSNFVGTSIETSYFDTSQVTNMTSMFSDCVNLVSLDVSSFNTSQVTSMSEMFSGCSSLTSLNLSNFDTSNVEYMSYMFSNDEALTSVNLTSFDTSKVTTMEGMFFCCRNIRTLDLSSFETSLVQCTDTMFATCTELVTIYASNTFVLDLNNMGYSDEMFFNAPKLVGGAGTVYTDTYVGTGPSYAHIDGGTSNPGYFTEKAHTVPTPTQPVIPSGGSSANSKGLLPIGSKYVIEEVVDSNGYAKVFDASGNEISPSPVTYRPSIKSKGVTAVGNENTIPYSNLGTTTTSEDIEIKLNKKIDNESDFDFETYHFKFKVYLNATSCTPSEYGTDATASQDFYTNNNGIIKISSIGSVGLTEDNLNDNICIVEYVTDDTTLNSKIYDSNHRLMSNASLPFYSKALQLTTEATIGDLYNNGTYSINITNTIPKGYFDVQKVVEGEPNFDFETYHFKFDVYDEDDQYVTTILTDNDGHATYGIVNGENTLPYNSSYYVKEKKDPETGTALIYTANGDLMEDTNLSLKPKYTGVTEFVSIEIENVGEGTDGANDYVLENEKDYGYILINKVAFDADEMDYDNEHFAFDIFDSNNNYLTRVYTNSDAQATYGYDSNTDKGTLPMGSLYYVKEVLDDDGNAVIFDNNYQPKESSIKTSPDYELSGNSITVNINNLLNIVHITNEGKKGSIEIRKDYETNDSTFFSNYHFAYDIYNEDRTELLTTVYTDDNGVAKYGTDFLGSGFLDYGSKYIIEEVLDSTGIYAEIYDSDYNIIDPTKPNYLFIEPTEKSKEVTVTNVTVGTATAVNIATISNEKIERGYVGVQKTGVGINIDTENYYFLYDVTGPGITEPVSICTNNEGIALYGEDTNGNGTLEKNSVYTFTEKTDNNGYAIVYGNDSCSSVVENDANKPIVKPSSASIDVTVENVGTLTVGENITDYPNYTETGYIVLQKTSLPEGTSINTENNHFKYKVSGPGVEENTTICTYNDGKATYGKDVSGHGILKLNNTYTFEEVVDENGYAVVYEDSSCQDLYNESDKAMVKPVENSISVTVEHVGLNQVGENNADYPNEYFGYVGVKKKIDDEDYNSSLYHFKYSVTGPGVVLPVSVCTNNDGIAIYGQDSNANGSLVKGSIYRFTEDKDENGLAIVYSDNTCTSVSSDSNKPVVRPARNSVDVTVENVGSMTLGYNESLYGNTQYKGYAAVQKVSLPEGTTIDTSKYFFKYAVTGDNVPANTTVCTDSTGLAVYGKDGNNNGTLELGSTYTFTEEVDANGYAVVYDDNSCSNYYTSADKVLVEPVDNSVNVIIENQGLSTAGMNVKNYSNKYYGYVGVIKKIDGEDFDSTNFHFLYNVTGDTVPANTTVCTNNQGLAIYGQNASGNGTLELGTSYTFSEDIDSNGYAKVYSDSSCSTEVSSNKPIVKPSENPIVVTVENVGSMTLGYNEKEFNNTGYLGYAGVQKVSLPEGTTIDTSINHFKYTVTGPNVPANTTVCTDNSGLAVYGKDIYGNGLLERDNIYTFTEEVDANGYAVVYNDSTCEQISTNANKAIVKPVENSVNVKIERLGLNNSGMNVENYSNKYLGYVGVQKVINGEPFVSEDYHFKYTVSGPGISNDTTVCTNNQGLAIYGQDSNGNGSLEKGSVYTFIEETDLSGQAVIYDSSSCNSLVRENTPVIVPSDNSVEVEVENVGSMSLGYNESDYGNTEYFGYIEIQKTSLPEGTTIDTENNHFKYTVSGPGVTTGTTICTNNNGIATYGKDTSNNGTLELGSTYTFTEEKDGKYAVVYSDDTCTQESVSSNKVNVEPVDDSIDVVVSHVGLNEAGANVKDYPNKHYGYVGVKKVIKPNFISLDKEKYHFRYAVTDSNNEFKGYSCTNNNGIAVYGVDSIGNGILEKGSVYTFTEEIDASGHAVVYGNSTCDIAPDENAPIVTPNTISVDVTVENVGTMTLGYNESISENNEYLGYAGVQKTLPIEGMSIDTVNNHFKYRVSGPGVTNGTTVCTNNQGLAIYGSDGYGNGILKLGDEYTFEEVLDSNGYALVYSNDSCTSLITTSDRILVVPVEPVITVKIKHVGFNTAGSNISNYPNTMLGYIGIQKTIDGNTFESPDYHFKYSVTGPNVPANTTVCTNDQGLAIYGSDALGNGKLKYGSVYTFTEEVDATGYATVYSDNTCSSQVQNDENKPKVRPSQSSVDITVQLVGNLTLGYNEAEYNNTEHLGYAGVQKVSSPSGTTIDFEKNYFKYTVTGPEVPANTTVCTNNQGLAIYGKDSNGKGLLGKDNTYTFTEEVDANGYAVVYNSDSCETLYTESDKALVKPVNNSVQVTINNLGLNENGLNVENYENKYLGYVGVQKTISGTPYSSSTYHFKYTVTGEGVENGAIVCTNNDGKAIYGQDSTGNGTLDQGKVYTFTEETDATGYATVYSDTNCLVPVENDSNKPIVRPSQSSIEVEVEKVGTLTLGYNEEEYDNNEFQGYAGVQKISSPSGTTIDTSVNHFKYSVTGPGVSANTSVCTNDQGLAIYGKDNFGNGTLNKNNIYTFTEEVDEQGYAVSYLDNECSTPNNTNSKVFVKPVNNSVNVKIENTGFNTSGENKTDYPNEYLGYVGVQKTIDGTPYQSNNYHFKFEVTGEGVQDNTTVCTNDQGLAVYGKDDFGNGTLKKGKVYTFIEETANDYATVYSDSDCSNLVENDENAPKVKPARNSVEVEVGMVGNLEQGSNNQNYNNVVELTLKGYAGVQKTSEPQGTTIDTVNNHFLYSVTGDGVPANTTVCTNDQGLAIYGKDSNNNGTLDQGKVYVFTEDVNVNGYAVSYTDSTCQTVNNTNTKVMVKPVNNSVSVRINNVGYNTDGENKENYPNKYYGYVGVQKTISGTAYGSADYHFRYLVTDSNGVSQGYACTDDNGLAIFGRDLNGNGTLEKNSSYTFEEIVNSNGYAKVYNSNICNTESDDPNRPLVKPLTTTVTVTATNVGTLDQGAKVSPYDNAFENCLSIKKTDSLNGEVLQGTEFELFTDNTCQTSTGKTATTNNRGIAVFSNLSGTTYYAKEISPVSGYTISEITNCKQVLAEPASVVSNNCKLNTITNDALYIGFYKLKEDGTPLTSAKFKVKNQSTDKYIKVSGTYNNCYAYSGETSVASEASLLTVNNENTGLYCIAKVPSGTYVAEEQETGNDGYWFNNGTISNLTTSTTINPVQGDGSNAIKNNPYVLTFFKEKEDSTSMENASFVLKESSTNNYIKLDSNTSMVQEYSGCYVYNGTTSNIEEASTVTSDSNGRICVIRIPNNKHYSVIEKSSGDSSYGVNENNNIELTPSTTVETKSNNNTLTDYPNYINFFKVNENDLPIPNTKFIVRNSNNDYIVATAPDQNRAKYKDCYIYSGTTPTTSAATEFITNTTGEVCIVKIPSGSTYTAIETESGDPMYYVDPNNNTISNIEVKVINPDESRTLITDNNSLKLLNSPFVLNFYKTDSDGNTPLDTAKFIVKDLDGKYVKANGVSANGCYLYNGTTTVESEATKFDTTGGEACIAKIPSGNYTVEEITPASGYTFGSTKTKTISTASSKVSRTDLNKFINYPTEVTFTKEVVGDYSSLSNNERVLLINQLKNLKFRVKSGNDTLSFINVNGVYEYARPGSTGTPTTELSLINEVSGSVKMNLTIKYLPAGLYTLEEIENDGCTTSLGNTCLGNGFYLSNPVEFEVTGNYNDKASASMTNRVTQMTFTKNDIYGYKDSSDIAKFENEEEVKAFDQITFKLKDSNGNYLKLVKIGDVGNGITDSYAEYFLVPSDLGDGTTGTELHTYGGNIKINNLCRDETYIIEEVSVPVGTVFTLPSTHPEVSITIPKTGDSTTNSNNKVVISDIPTRVVFQKVDSRDNTEIITDQNAEFEVYRCAKGQTTCTKATSVELMHFEDKAVITGDQEESEEVYKAISSSDIESGNVGVTTLKLNSTGKIILRYLPADYSYILYEKTAPKGYYDLVESSTFGNINFTVSNSSVSENVKNVPNYPTTIKFNKTDLYQYYSGLDNTETTQFDTIKFRLYDASGNLVQLSKVQDGEYRYYSGNGSHTGNVTDLYTKNAELSITHLDRNTTYYIEEYEVPSNSVFINPNNIDNSTLPGGLANNNHPIITYNIGKDTTTSTPQAVTNLIENRPTRVAFKKVDLNTSEIVIDQNKSATFKVYQCPVTTSTCDENGTLIYFEDAAVIDGDSEDIIDGIARKAYKYSKNNESTGKVSDLKLDNGYLILRYLPTDYKYVLVETTAPDGYYNPPTTEKYTEFSVLSTTLPNGETYAIPGDVTNTPIEITFTKDDFYRYMDENDIVKFETEDEVKSFDEITFVLKNANGTPVELCKTADKTIDGKSISTYQFLGATCDNKVTELHTKNGKLMVKNLYRNTTYTVEETAVPTHSMFTLPDDHQTVSYTISSEGNVETNRANTKLMNDLPTRVLIYKKDDRTNNNITESSNKKETATFELYRCKNTSVDCTKENTNEKVTFMKKAVLTVGDIANDNSITDSDLGKEAYKFVSTSDLESMSVVDREFNTTTTLELDSNGQILLRYLPANYKYVLVETNAPDGYYNYVSESLNGEVSINVTNSGNSGTVYNFVNTHTEIKFTKDDLLKYYTSSDKAVSGNDTKIFDSMTFVLRDENGDIVNLTKVQDGEYRFIQNDGTYSNNSIQELHTKDGNLVITHLFRNETYYIEEIASDPEGYFILPNNIDNTNLVESKAGNLKNNKHPIVKYNIPNTIPDSEESRSLTQLIENNPTRVVFEKRDASTGELISDEANQDNSYSNVKTTFKVYQCANTVDTCNIENGTLLKFESRSYHQELTSDINSINNPIYVYKYSKLNNGTISELNTDRGVLVLSYLPTDYKYVLYETIAPNGYYNPSELEAQTEFEVKSTTLPTGETYELLTSRITNEPTEIFFEKRDIYDYYNGNDLAKLNSDEKIFDSISFILRDKNGEVLSLKCASNGEAVSTINGVCPTGEYRYLPYKESENTLYELHTKNGIMTISHLYKGETYYIEEIGSGNGNFIVPTNMTYAEELPFNYNGHPVVKYELQDTKPANNASVTKVMENIPTRVTFQKRDNKYGYLIDDETTTFNIYQCQNTVEKCTPSNGTLVYFNERAMLTGDAEDSGKEVYTYSKVNSTQGVVSDLHPYHAELIIRYLPSDYKYVLVETVSPLYYSLPSGENAYTEFTVESTTVEVEEVDVPNKPTSLLIRKYGEDGKLLEGAEFKIYEGTTCEAGVKPKDQPKQLLTLKTIRDGIYENREVKDTDTLITCTDKEDDKCSDITTSLTYDQYVDTWTNFDNSVNQNNERVSIQSGEILVQYLDYGHCYIIEEVKAPKGHTLPENEDDRFAMVTLNKENDVVDTNKDLVNKPTPFTFYKFDDYNNLIDGGEFKLQKLNSKKKYEDVTVSEEVKNGKLYYKVDNNTTNKKIVTANGSATVYYLEKGQYRIVETKAPEGMELPSKEINVSVFYVDENGQVTGNAIITNKPKSTKVVIKPQASAELVVTISTGMKVINYAIIIIIALITTLLLILVSRKRKKYE